MTSFFKKTLSRIEQPKEELVLPTDKDGNVMFRVYLLDGSYKAVKIKPSTTIEELWEIVADKLMLNAETCQNFFLFGMQNNLELLLYSHQVISDMFKDWASFLDRYDHLDDKSLTTMAMDRIKRGNSAERIGIRNLNHSFHVIFRTTSIITLKDELYTKDEHSNHLYFIQAVYNVINSNYPCESKTAVLLGALQLQLTIGNFTKDKHTRIQMEDAIVEFVPEHLYEKKNLVNGMIFL